ncbi:MAG: MFS transporter [Holosporaceae bacterium]|jgi:MFS family permease|nr:MFS transporter [Holosporaceae bacterium]
MAKKKSGSNAVVFWGLANIFYLYEVILRVSPSVMMDDLMAHYAVTASIFGVIVTCFYCSYVALQIPCGLILDKFGPRILVSSSAILSTLGSVLFALTDQIYVAQIGRCMVGAGAACAFTSCLQIASLVFSPKQFAMFAGITNMMGTLGALCSGFPVAKSVNEIGWRQTIFALAIIGMIIAGLVLMIVPKSLQNKNDHPQKDGNDASVNNGDRWPSFMITLKQVLKNKQIILSGLVGGFMYLPVSVFSELWAVPFFMTKYNIDNETASIATSILFIGFAVGSIPVVMVAEKLNGYMRAIRLSISCVAPLFIALVYVHDMYLSFAIVFIIGIFTGAEVITFTCAKNNESSANTGTAIAFANALIMLAGLIFQPLFGLLLDVFWTGAVSMEHGVRIYEFSCYQKAILLTIPTCLVIAYILSLFVKETIHMGKN